MEFLKQFTAELFCSALVYDQLPQLAYILCPWQLKKSKSWGPFWSYQLNSAANSAHFAQFLGKWAELAVLFSW